MAQQNRGLRPIERLIVAIVLAVAATLAIGWLALVISRAGVSPAVLYPIAVGAAVGGCQVLIFRRLNLSPPLFAAAALGLVLGLLAVATEDYCGYREYLREYADAQRGNHLASIVGESSDEWKPIPLTRYVAKIVARAHVVVARRGVDRGVGGRHGFCGRPVERRWTWRQIGAMQRIANDTVEQESPAEFALAAAPPFGYNPPPLASQFEPSRLAGEARETQRPRMGVPTPIATQTPRMEAPSRGKIGCDWRRDIDRRRGGRGTERSLRGIGHLVCPGGRGR